jgi:hypothetical protein
MDNTKWTIIEYNQWINDECPLNGDVLELNIYYSKFNINSKFTKFNKLTIFRLFEE